MGSSLPFPPPSRLPNNLLRDFSSIAPVNRFTGFSISRQRRTCLLTSSAERALDDSWIHVDGNSHDGFGGWWVSEPRIGSRKDFPKFLIVGAGTSMAILLAAFVHYSSSRKGFKFQFNAPFHVFQEPSMPSDSISDTVKNTKSNAPEVHPVSEAKLEEQSDMSYKAFNPKKENRIPASGENKRVIIPLPTDSTQQDALFVMKKLKIIENFANADELCTRREYARWLVKANSLLERNPKHRIVPLMLIAGSTVRAFDDVNVNDPDFCCIQALGEAGTVFSKLPTVNSSSLSGVGSSDGQGRFDFSPESFISRYDLINWKVLLEYPFTTGMDEKMLRKKTGFLDLSAISLDASPQLFVDMLAGDKSIIRRVFGNCRRLQPHKPTTVAQAAVALTSGRMAEAIRAELSRLEAENLSRLNEMEEIRSELNRRGEIQRFWEEQMNKEKDRGLEVERDLLVALHDLEEEKMTRFKGLAEYTKEKAALDCQQQLLLSLREEVDGMCDRLAYERANFAAEQRSLEELFTDLRNKQDATTEAKSILEAEKEAIRILRSWVEEEARRMQARVKVLEEAAQRWKWNDELRLPQTNSPENDNS